ncbi:sucrase ferredoxin [Pseudonocardia charpentierae]|uniref:Sucrase ferredoxin n=1 Tax=Pseudonocardia charpentierae TaxID=3075545 RepID=A0ABU2NHE2_9PSEU|nr:sucrase ferredoxin [Pseudonocardia sp. DSM 45834]MDT0353360.1 sucrase ferredoxin [Pseudonocardia sp. DSM 45834]
MGADRSTPWCAALARALDEPLPGTASVARRWVGIEHRGTWPHEITQHRDDAVRAFIARARSSGWRPVLVRRPGRRPSDGPTRIFFADTAPPAPRTTVLRVVDPAELASIAFPADGTPLPGETVADPMLLVCTHGRRDRCCAVDGRALARAVVATGESDVWESTHLGGHRFAPTALVLPTGYLYGRLDVAGAVLAHKAAAVGEMEPGLCRGRATWTQPGQVAELAVRAKTGLRGANVLQVEPATQQGPAGAELVTVAATDGRRWQVTVRPISCPGDRPVSCGAAALPVTALSASRVRRLA